MTPTPSASSRRTDRAASDADASDAPSWSATWAHARAASSAGSTHVDHKAIGMRYIVTAFVFFAARRARWRC